MPSIVPFQSFMPHIAGPLPGRLETLQSSAEETSQPGAIQATVPDEAAGSPHYFIPQAAPKIISQLAPVIIPAGTDRMPFNLPSNDLDWIAFYAPTAPAATVSVGPNVPIVQILTAGWLVMPVSTFQYQLSNTAGTPYTLYIQYGRGYPPPLFQKV